MKIKKGRKILLIMSCMWLLAAVVPFVLVLHNLKFPKIDDLFYMPILLLIFVMPVLGLVFSLIPDKWIKRTVYGVLISCFAVYFVYILFATFGFSDYQTPFYPITLSSTTDAENYLVLDDIGENDALDVVKSVFLSEIPANALDVDYYYECEPSKYSWIIDATWCLPKEEYEAEKQRISAMAKNTVEKDGVTYYDMSVDDNYCHVGFCDEELWIDYVDVLKYYYDPRMVSGIGNWE